MSFFNSVTLLQCFSVSKCVKTFCVLVDLPLPVNRWVNLKAKCVDGTSTRYPPFATSVDPHVRSRFEFSSCDFPLFHVRLVGLDTRSSPRRPLLPLDPFLPRMVRWRCPRLSSVARSHGVVSRPHLRRTQTTAPSNAPPTTGAPRPRP